MAKLAVRNFYPDTDVIEITHGNLSVIVERDEAGTVLVHVQTPCQEKELTLGRGDGTVEP